MANDFAIPENLSREEKFTVKQEHSAAHLGSGSISVLSTPSMILFMEIAARNALENILPEEYSSVGIEVNVKHLKAVKIGENVVSIAKLTEQDRKKMVFEVEVKHGEITLGKGSHTRYIIDKTKFLSKI